MEKRVKKQIMIPKEVRAEIIGRLNVDPATVTRALQYMVDNSTARLIRAMAMEMGGRIYDGTRDAGARNVVVLKCLKNFQPSSRDFFQYTSHLIINYFRAF